MALSDNIRYYRELANIYQSELGRDLGVSAQAVSKWETGKAEPNIDSLRIMSEIFHVTVDELLSRDRTKPPSPLGDLTIQERNLIRDFRSLDDHGREFILDAMRMSRAVKIQKDSASSAGEQDNPQKNPVKSP